MMPAMKISPLLTFNKELTTKIWFLLQLMQIALVVLDMTIGILAALLATTLETLAMETPPWTATPPSAAPITTKKSWKPTMMAMNTSAQSLEIVMEKSLTIAFLIVLNTNTLTLNSQLLRNRTAQLHTGLVPMVTAQEKPRTALTSTALKNHTHIITLNGKMKSSTFALTPLIYVTTQLQPHAHLTANGNNINTGKTIMVVHPNALSPIILAQEKVQHQPAVSIIQQTYGISTVSQTMTTATATTRFAQSLEIPAQEPQKTARPTASAIPMLLLTSTEMNALSMVTAAMVILALTALETI